MLRVCKGEHLSEKLEKRAILYNADVFNRAASIIENNPSERFVPAITSTGKLFLIFDDGDDTYLKDVYIRELRTLRKKEALSFKEVFPKVKQVCIYGVNELSLELYYYLNERQINYRLVGDEWSLLGDFCATNDSTLYSSNEIMNIYSDEAGLLTDNLSFTRNPIVLKRYGFINARLAWSNYIELMKKTAQKVLENGGNVALVNIPDLDELTCLSDDEKYCIENEVTLYAYKSSLNKDEHHLQQLGEVYGAEHVNRYITGETVKGRITSSHFGCVYYSALEEERNYKVYLIGPCTVWQDELMPEDTIVHRLQNKLDRDCSSNYKVIGISVATEYFDCIESITKSFLLRKGDVVLYLCMRCSNLPQKYSLPTIDLKYLFDSRTRRYFSNHPLHMNQECAEMVSDSLYDCCNRIIASRNNADDICMYPVELDDVERDALKSFLKGKTVARMGIVRGCIVMNCNPYTLGHDYLIKKATERVDELIVFVVEENKSAFDFYDRFEIVKKNTKKYHNVIVYPSGSMILSNTTLPTYFVKEEKEEAKVNASDDLRIFALGIAPFMGIKIRFVGEEPIDKVTAQYNRQMKEILPHYGIEVVEIPRLEYNSHPISASIARQYIKDKDFESCENYLTTETIDYIKDHSLFSMGSLDFQNIIELDDNGEIIEWFKMNKNAVVYGTGHVAKAVMNIVNEARVDASDVNYVITNATLSEEFFCGKQVYNAEQFFENNIKNLPVLICAYGMKNRYMKILSRRYTNRLFVISDSLCNKLIL